jgi:anti-sigma factor (TIGR02949 family)
VISCADAVRQLWAYLDGEIPAGDADAVERHLERCRRCCGEAAFADELRTLLARSTEAVVPADVSARMESFLSGLEQVS